MDPNIRKRRFSETDNSKEEFHDFLSSFQKLPNDEKKHEACQQLFKMCSVTLLSQIGDTVKSMRKRNFISDSPSELSKRILHYLGNSDIVSCQLVCKRWRKAVIKLPLFRIICKHLDVDKWEYATKEQAIAICDHIVDKRKLPLDDWFSHVVYDPENRINSIESVQLVKFDNVDYIITVGSDVNERDIVDIAIIEDGQASNLCRIELNGWILGLQFLSPESIFIGNDRTIKRWNIRSELVLTYRCEHMTDVLAVNGNEERDLLFGCDNRGHLISWRISTGELLCQMQVFGGDCMSIHLNILADSSTSIIGALAGNNKRLLIFSCTTDGQLDRLYELESAFYGPIKFIRPTLDGFRFLHADKQTHLNGHLEIWNWFLTDYCFETGEVKRRVIDYHHGRDCHAIETNNGLEFITFYEGNGLMHEYSLSLDIGEVRRQKIDFGNDSDEYGDVVQVRGSKFILFNVWYKNLNRYRLMLFEKQGGVWKSFKESSSMTVNRMDDPEYISAGDWLNGLRPENTKGIAYAYYDANFDGNNCKIYCAIWK